MARQTLFESPGGSATMLDRFQWGDNAAAGNHPWKINLVAETAARTLPQGEHYGYDGLFRRTTKISGGSTRHYYSDRWKLLEERVDSSSDANHRYLWGVRSNHRDELVLRDCDTTGNSTFDERLYATKDFYNSNSIINSSANVKVRYATPRLECGASWHPTLRIAAVPISIGTSVSRGNL